MKTNGTRAVWSEKSRIGWRRGTGTGRKRGGRCSQAHGASLGARRGAAIPRGSKRGKDWNGSGRLQFPGTLLHPRRLRPSRLRPPLFTPRPPVTQQELEKGFGSRRTYRRWRLALVCNLIAWKYLWPPMVMLFGPKSCAGARIGVRGGEEEEDNVSNYFRQAVSWLP